MALERVVPPVYIRSSLLIRVVASFVYWGMAVNDRDPRLVRGGEGQASAAGVVFRARP